VVTTFNTDSEERGERGFRERGRPRDPVGRSGCFSVFFAAEPVLEKGGKEKKRSSREKGGGRRFAGRCRLLRFKHQPAKKKGGGEKERSDERRRLAVAHMKVYLHFCTIICSFFADSAIEQDVERKRGGGRKRKRREKRHGKDQNRDIGAYPLVN